MKYLDDTFRHDPGVEIDTTLEDYDPQFWVLLNEQDGGEGFNTYDQALAWIQEKTRGCRQWTAQIYGDPGLVSSLSSN